MPSVLSTLANRCPSEQFFSRGNMKESGASISGLNEGCSKVVTFLRIVTKHLEYNTNYEFHSCELGKATKSTARKT